MAESAFAKFRAQSAANAPATRPAPQAAQPFVTPSRGKYSGVSAGSNRNPLPQPGAYLFRVIRTQEKTNDNTGTFYSADLEILESSNPGNPAGTSATFLQGSNPGKQLKAAGPRIKMFVMATAGFDNESEYDQMDPDGQFIDVTAGIMVNNDGTPKAYPDGSPIVGNPLAGRLVRAVVSFGNPVLDKKTQQPTGDYYREYSWSPVAEEDQASAAAQ